VKNLFSRREDVTLAIPYGPPVRRWEQVAKITEHASSLRSAGKFVGSEIVAKYVTAELAYVVQIERAGAKIDGREDITPYAVRSTMIFRPEDGEWKVVHRHADWTCVGSVDCLRLRTVRGKESIATNKPGLPTGVSPRSYPAG
jgi:ketosteroid isomerase-like protein